MLRYLVLLIAGLFSNHIQAQKEIPNGIYGTNNALYVGNPLPQYNVSLKDLADTTELDLKSNRFQFRPSLSLKRAKVFALSDGYNYYICSETINSRGLYKFYKLVFKGNRLGVFHSPSRFVEQNQRFGIGFVIMDLKTGHLYPLKRKSLRNLLNESPDLLAKLNKMEKPSDEDLIHLIKLYDRTLQ